MFQPQDSSVFQIQGHTFRRDQDGFVYDENEELIGHQEDCEKAYHAIQELAEVFLSIEK